eukprot:4415211-Amphidinium_carterae.1
MGKFDAVADLVWTATAAKYVALVGPGHGPGPVRPAPPPPSRLAGAAAKQEEEDEEETHHSRPVRDLPGPRGRTPRPSSSRQGRNGPRTQSRVRFADDASAQSRSQSNKRSKNKIPAAGSAAAGSGDRWDSWSGWSGWDWNDSQGWGAGWAAHRSKRQRGSSQKARARSSSAKAKARTAAEKEAKAEAAKAEQ